MHTIPDILRNTNYYIEYDYVEDKSIVKVSWDNKEYEIKYDVKNQTLNCSFDDVSIKCPEYLAGIITNYLVRVICDHYNYHYNLCLLKYNGNLTVNFYNKEINNEETASQAILMNEIYNDLISDGLRAEHVDIATEFDLFDGLRILTELIIGVSIDPLTKTTN